MLPTFSVRLLLVLFLLKVVLFETCCVSVVVLFCVVFYRGLGNVRLSHT